MHDNNEHRISNKMSMALSVCIALFIVAIFSTVSIIILESVDNIANNKMKRVHLQSNRDYTSFIL